MKKVLLISLFFLINTPSWTQQCNTFECAYQKAEQILNTSKAKDKYEKVLANLDDAENFAGGDEVKKKKVKKLRQKAFESIRKEKEEAEEVRSIAESALNKSEQLVSFFNFNQDRAWAYKEGKFALIDSSSVKQWTPFIFDSPEPFRADGIAIAKKNGLYCFVKINGETVEGFEYIYPTNNGWYKVRKDGKETFFDKSLAPAKNFGWYNKIEAFIEGKAKIEIEGGRKGIVDTAGKIIVEPIYSEIYREGNVATYENYIHYLDSDKIFKSKYNKIFPTPFSNKMFYTHILKDGKPYSIRMLVDIDDNVICENFFAFAKGKNLLFLKVTDKVYFEESIIAGQYNVSASNGYWKIYNLDSTKFVMEEEKFYIKDENVLPSKNNWIGFEYKNKYELENGNQWINSEKGWGLIDNHGNFIIKPQFTEIKIDNRHKVTWVMEEENGRMGLYDFSGKVIFEPFTLEKEDNSYTYNNYEFSDSVSVVKCKNIHIVFNNKGEILFERSLDDYDYIDRFSDGVAWAWKRTNEVESHSSVYNISLLDKKGNVLSKKTTLLDRDIDHKRFTCGVAKFEYSLNKWGVLDKKLDTVLSPIFDRIYIFEKSKTIFAIFEENKYGQLFDIKGNLLLDSLGITDSYNDSLIWFSYYDSRLEGLINNKGKIIFSPQFERGDSREGGLYDFEGNICWIKKSKRWGLITKSGQFLIEPRFDEIFHFRGSSSFESTHFKEGISFAYENNRLMLVTDTGKIIPTLFYKKKDNNSFGQKEILSEDTAFENGKVYVGDNRINNKGEIIVTE